MNSRRVVMLVCVAALILAGVGVGLAKASADDTNAIAVADTQILSEIRDHSQVMENLEYLSDEIGPRLTGSPQLKQANDWIAAKFREYGLTNVHLESWTIAHSWTRGTARARIFLPVEHPLTIASAGWSPGTNGIVRGPLVYFDAKTKDEFARFRGKLKGAIVIYQEPESLSPPRRENPNSPLVRPMQAPPLVKGQPAEPSPFAAFQEVARARNEFFKQEGVAAVLRDSGKPHGLLNMTGIGGEKFDIGAIPTAFITGEGYRMLFRMQKHGKVEVEIEMTNSFGDKPMDVYNTVAEIRGTEKPDEIVILGAHLDSWDLGTGSTDNGTGSMAVLEAARTLAKLNLKPKRTIRFVLFSGEEEGLVGSVKYVESHTNELEKISAVLVHDTGTGRVLTLGLHDNYQDREIVDQVLAPLKELKLLEPTMRRSFGTDHASFDDAGVPGFQVIQDGAEYSLTHHSQSDTFDKVWNGIFGRSHWPALDRFPATGQSEPLDDGTLQGSWALECKIGAMEYRKQLDARSRDRADPFSITSRTDTRDRRMVRGDERRTSRSCDWRCGRQAGGLAAVQREIERGHCYRWAPRGNGFAGPSFVDAVGRRHHPRGDAENGRQQADGF